MNKSNTKQEGKWTKNKGNLWESVRKDEQVCWKVALAEWWGFWRAAMISLLNWISLKCQERKTVAETKWKRGEYQTSAVRRDQPAVGCVLKHWLRWHTHTHIVHFHLFLFFSEKTFQVMPQVSRYPTIHLILDIKTYQWHVTSPAQSVFVGLEAFDWECI